MRLPPPTFLLCPAVLACGGADRTGWRDVPEPWSDLGAVALEPFRPVLARDLGGMDLFERLHVLRSVPLTFLEGGDLKILDRHYAHLASSVCVPTTLWPDLEDGSRQGTCPSGTVETRRGLFAPEGRLRAFTIDDADFRLYAVDDQGVLYTANADVLEGNPLDFLRFVAVDAAPLPTTSLDSVLLSDPLGGLVYADGSEILHLALDGTVEHPTSLPSIVTGGVSDDQGVWLFTADDLFVRDANGTYEALGVGPALKGVTDGVGGLYVSVAAQSVVHVVPTGEGFAFDETAVAGLAGPLAYDVDTGRLVLGLEDGVAIRDAEGMVTRVSNSPVLDIAWGAGREMLLYRADGTLTIHVDETALTQGAPLHLWMAAMAETPTSQPEEVACSGEEVDLHRIWENAHGNMRMFATTPMPVALGITPALARRARSCNAVSLFELLWSYGEVETGVLYHDVPSECAGFMPCYESFLADERAAVLALGASVQWVGGLDAHWDDGYDWVQGLVDEGIADRLMFFGLGVLPDIDQADPRNKEPFPYGPTPSTRTWATSASTLFADEGGIPLLPGNTISGYSLAGCPNLFVAECKLVDLGGGSQFGDDDIDVLDLLLVRALAVRSEAGPDTWYFHMPDIGITDYTQGCEMDEAGTWSGGSTCQAALLQRWILGVHQRFVLNGLAEWAVPSEVP